MLLDSIFTATSSVGGVRMIGAIKLKRVSIWSPITATFAAQTVSLEFPGSYGPSKILSDTSVGLMPAHVTSRPPQNASNSWWSINGSNESEVLFAIVVPQESIIDVEVSMKLIDREAATAVSAALTGVVLGTVYYGPLNGVTTKTILAAGSVTAYQ
jgi:hypothetical protein